MLALLRQLPVQLLFSVGTAFLLGRILDANTIAWCYTMSALFIEILLFLLPILIFSFMLQALVHMKNGVILIIAIFIGVTLSNVLSLLVTYGVAHWTLPFLGLSYSPDFAQQFQSNIRVIWDFKLPEILSAQTAMLTGMLLGFLGGLLPAKSIFKNRLIHFSMHLNQAVRFFLEKAFMPFLPLYVFGFCLKLSHDGSLLVLFEEYGKVFLLSMVVLIGYISLFYWIASRRSFTQTYQNIKTMLPAAFTAFSTMSSAASMPVTLRCTEMTTQDKDFSDLIIPATSNIHMLGDNITITIMALMLLTVFGLPVPDFVNFTLFAVFFSVAKLSSVGLPGASVLVILPTLQQYLGFTPEMISIVTTIYVLQDPFGTTGNVMGNGAFALILHKAFPSK